MAGNSPPHNFNHRRFHGRMQSIRDQMIQTEKECVTFTHEYEKEKKLRETYESEVQTLNKLKTKHENDLKKERDMKGKLKEELGTERDKRMKAETKLNKEIEARQKLEAELNKERQRIAVDLEGELNKERQKVTVLEDLLSKEREKISALERDGEEKYNDLVKALNQLDSALKGNVRLKNVCEAERRRAEEYERSTSSERMVKEDLHQKLVSLEKDYEELNMKCKLLAKDNEAMQQQILNSSSAQSFTDTDASAMLQALQLDASQADIPDFSNTIRQLVETNNVHVLQDLLRSSDLSVVNSQTEEVERAIVIAAADGYFETVQILLGAGVSVNVKLDGETALHKAAENGHLNICKLLISKHADINSLNAFGMTPLHYATMNGRREVTELLVRYNAHINASDEYGNTALHYSARYGDLPLVKFLIVRSSSFYHRNKHGQIPLDLVVLPQCQDVCAYLKSLL